MSAASFPQRFGTFVILDRIGDGGMAEIFLAKMQGYSGFEKLVALKKILPRYSQNPAFARMLIHEAKLAARLQHFNVVQVLDLGEIESQVFIAMEYVRGRDLAALLSNTYRRKERLPVEISLFMEAEFLTGLDYAHRLTTEDGTPLGLIHRDISPQNVLISYEGEVKLTDFGIARVMERHSDQRLPGNLHGKFGYMSPEQIEGRPLDQRCDIFSSGVVLYEMLTGQRLFRGKTPKATVEMIRTQPIPPPSSINPEVPPWVDEVVAKALARDREERYQTVGGFLGDISRAANRLTNRASRRDLAVYMRRQFGAVVSREQSTTPAARTRAVSGFSPTAGSRVPLGEILLARGSVKVEQLELALTEQRARGGRIGELLLESGVIDDEELAQALASQSNTRFIETASLRAARANPAYLARFPRSAADGMLILPLAGERREVPLTLAVADPYDQRAILESKIVLGVNEATILVAAKSAIREAITRLYGPEAEPPETPLPVVESMIEETAPAPVATPVVVVGDHDAASLESLVARLKAEDFEVYSAKDGKSARALCREKEPLVVLLDAALPGIDGYNVLLDLRSRNSDAAVFITSSRTDGFHQAKALELGADDFLSKPHTLEVVASKVRREVQKRSARRPRAPAPVSFNGVSGSLQDMTALDIVQSLELGRKTAQVVLQYDDGRAGEVGIVQGEIKSCICGAEVGEKGFYRLAPPGPGLFRIEYRDPKAEANIAKPNTFLILEALRRFDEEARSSIIPPPLVDPRALVGDLSADLTSTDLAGSIDLNRQPQPMANRPAQSAQILAPAAPTDPQRRPLAPPPDSRWAPLPDAFQGETAATAMDLPPLRPAFGQFDQYRRTPEPFQAVEPTVSAAAPPAAVPFLPSELSTTEWMAAIPPPATRSQPAPRYSGPPPPAASASKQRLARMALQRVSPMGRPDDEARTKSTSPKKPG